MAATGGIAVDYARAVQRRQLAEHAAVACCRHLAASALSEICPGLGIPSDLSLVWDGVSIGGTMWSRGETLCVLGAGFVDPAGRIQ